MFRSSSARCRHLGTPWPRRLLSTAASSRPRLRRPLSTAASSADGPQQLGVPISATTEHILRGSWSGLDADAPEMLRALETSDAALIWHKHSSFMEHLTGVWKMLCAWDQPRPICRLGLFHSAYSNSFVSMNLFDPKRDRAAVAELIGDEAERLVYGFCSIDRQLLEDTVLREATIRRDGYTLAHIHTGDDIHVSGPEAAAFVIETLADEMEQRFGWQSDLEAGRVAAAWPGPMPPTLRMARTNALALALRASELVPVEALPPIFGRCGVRLEPEAERQARDLYWAAVCAPALDPAADAAALGAQSAAQLAQLDEAARLNPFVGEPHVVKAQLLLQQSKWGEAEAAAAHGVSLLAMWATSWDKRMPWNAWLNWGRCLALQAALHEWPTTHGGIESLGATHPRMRFRGLNTSRNR